MRTNFMIAAVLVAGCSPYVYETEIDAFSGGVDDLSAASTEGRQTLAVSGEAHDLEVWAAQGQRDLRSVGCTEASGTDGLPCRIVAVKPGAEEQEYLAQRTNAFETLAEADAGRRALVRYAAALKAVTDAEDRKALDAEIDKLAGTVGALAAASKAPGAAAVGPAVKAALGLVAVSLDQRRYDALAAAVSAAHPHVERIAATYGVALRALTLTIAAEDLERLSQIRSAPPRAGGEALRAWLLRLQAAAKDYEAHRGPSPAAVTSEAIAAHAALKAALEDPSRQAEPVFATVSTFAKSARDLRDAVVD